MDQCLIEALLIQYNEGNKIDKGFKEVAYVAVANALKLTFHIDINKDNVIIRMETIKKGYRDIEQMLSQSGFTFNYLTKKVECSDEVWETYLKEHPKVKNLRYKRIEMLEELEIVCGNDRATGEWCRGGPDINIRRTTKDNYNSQSDAPVDDTNLDDVRTQLVLGIILKQMTLEIQLLGVVEKTHQEDQLVENMGITIRMLMHILRL